MSFLKNTVSLLAVFSIIPAAYAVSARPSIIAASAATATGAARRMPTMSAYISGLAGSGTTTGGTSSSFLSDTECVESYTDCIQEDNACGPNLVDCTNRILFQAKMPQCLTTLAQCSSSGIAQLFGTSAVDALTTVSSTNQYGEALDYAYPDDGSVLGQMINAARIENMFDTPTCIKRYTSCLRKESVCGEDFELCTSNSEFKKQAVQCDATLARCQSAGKIELFGAGNGAATSSVAPNDGSRIGVMIDEGASLAAVNAVSTCYKVTDQCILNACAANPYKCHEGTTVATIELAESILNGTAVADAIKQYNSSVADENSKSNISAYIRNECQSTVGSNKYCYATTLGEGKLPTAAQLRDEDNQADVFADLYASRYNSAMRAKITEMVNKFDARAKEKCSETIKSCAMRTCGGGSGAACYKLTFGGADGKTINNQYAYSDIKTGCQAIVNTDPNCQYAAQNPNDVGTYNYSYVMGGFGEEPQTAFDILFPPYDDTNASNDPIGVIASLNAALSTNYSDAALAQMKKRCQTVATSCVKTLCGTDYTNCYRNRTDIYSSLTDTNNTAFNKSMNKVGGVLDYTIVLGMCIDTVKNSDACEEHLKIEAIKVSADRNRTSSWGTKDGGTAGSVREGWIDAGSTLSLEADEGIQATDENGAPLCFDKCQNQGVCDNMSSANCGIFDTPVMIAESTYIATQAANSLFKDLIYDLEIEAQAKYNAKLTQQQNVCLAANSGGVMGKNETGSTFQWVKLRGNKVPNNYSTAGLKSNQFTVSNELYGSFCRARVTLQSSDKAIQETIAKGKDWSVAYFAVGDTFTCGSWIPGKELEKIAQAVADAELAGKRESQKKTRTWLTIGGGLLSTIGGGHLMNSIQDGALFGGLTNDKTDALKVVQKAKKSCTNYNSIITELDKAQDYAKAGNDGDCKKALSNAYDSMLIFSQNADFIGVPVADNLNMNDYIITSCENNTATMGSEDVDTIKQKVRKVSNTCSSISVTDAADGKSKIRTEEKRRSVTNLLGAAAIGTAGTMLVNRLTYDIQDANLDRETKEIFQEWMDDIGSKIECYIGSNPAGSYGDTVIISIE